MDAGGETPYLTTRQVANLCGAGTSESTIRYAARVGMLGGHKVGNAWRFSESDARDFCADLQRRKRDRRRHVGHRRSALGSLRGVAGKGIAVLHLAASVVSLIPAILWDEYGVIGYLLAAWNGAVGALLFVRTRVTRWVQVDGGDTEDIDPDVIDLYRSRLKDRTGREGTSDTAAEPVSWQGQSAGLAPASHGPLTMWQAVQIASAIVAFVYGAGVTTYAFATNAGESDETTVDEATTRPFTTCDDWLSGTDVLNPVVSLEADDPTAGRLVRCSGRQGSALDITEAGDVTTDLIDIDAILYFPGEESPDDWADTVYDEPPGCETVTLPESGLRGCLLQRDAIVFLTVRVRDDHVVEVSVGDLSGAATGLPALAVGVADRVAVTSRAE